MHLNLDLQQFLKRHWQKRPLLIRGAFEGFESPINGDDLAALAADPRAMARLVSHDPLQRRWTLQHGPFEAGDYSALGESNWTLLVQDVDKWLPDVFAPLLAQFAFLPSWRIEDLMVSFAAPGGSVGAHVDQYDVFLLQASGRRHWKIDSRSDCPLELDSRAPLKLLRRFEPNQDWILEPGDMLYLPPGVPHHGIATEHCLTFSIGLRAPTMVELLQAVADDLLQQQPEGRRYRDPPLHGAGAAPLLPGQIDERAIKRVRRGLRRLLKGMNEATLAQSFGHFMSQYRAPRAAQPLARAPSLPSITRRLNSGARLRRDVWQRLNWSNSENAALLHGAGISVRLPISTAVQLCADEPMDLAHWQTLATSEQRAVQALLQAGALHWIRG